MKELYEKYTRTQFLGVTWYVSGEYAIEESDTRFDLYNFYGVPSAMFDGIVEFVGGVGGGGSMLEYYDPTVAERSAMTSPVLITATHTVAGTAVSVAVRVDVLATITTTDNVIHFIVVEDNAHDQLNLARDMLADEAFSLTTRGEYLELTRDFTLGEGWVAGNVNVIVLIQSHGAEKTVLQATQSVVQGS